MIMVEVKCFRSQSQYRRQHNRIKTDNSVYYQTIGVSISLNNVNPTKVSKLRLKQQNVPHPWHAAYTRMLSNRIFDK